MSAERHDATASLMFLIGLAFVSVGLSITVGTASGLFLFGGTLLAAGTV